MAEDKKKLDFDFSGISGEHKTVTPKKVKKTAKQITSDKKSNIVLSLLVEGREIGKDLNDVTGEEFAQWASRVYPGELPEPDKLDKVDTRKRVFKQILHYHVNSPFWMGKDKKQKPLC